MFAVRIALMGAAADSAEPAGGAATSAGGAGLEGTIDDVVARMRAIDASLPRAIAFARPSGTQAPPARDMPPLVITRALCP